MAGATGAISLNTSSIGGRTSYHSTGNNNKSYKHELQSSDLFSFAKKHPQVCTNAIHGGSNASIW